MSGRHLTLYDFRDVDLMHKIVEEGGAEGVTSRELAEALGMKDDVSAVAIRSAWMRRYGFFDFDDKTKMWSLSDAGERIIQADTKASAIDRLANVPDEQLVDVMAHVTSRYRHGELTTATLLRREFVYGTAPQSVAFQRNGGRRRKR
jgi:hypothetical protein